LEHILVIITLLVTVSEKTFLENERWQSLIVMGDTSNFSISRLTNYSIGKVLRTANQDRETANSHALSSPFDPDLKASPSLFTHAKSAQSVNHDINTRDRTSRHACLEVKFGFKRKIGSLSEGSVPVIFISMLLTH
jgi:hypothetical protein